MYRACGHHPGGQNNHTWRYALWQRALQLQAVAILRLLLCHTVELVCDLQDTSRWHPLSDMLLFNLMTLRWKERILYPQLARSYHSVAGWGDGTIAAFGGFQKNNGIPGDMSRNFDVSCFFHFLALLSFISSRALSLELCNHRVLFLTVTFVCNDLILSRPNETYWRKLVLPHDKQMPQWRALLEAAHPPISNFLEHTAVLDQYSSMYIWGGR